jgi:hypothetical protein
MKAIQFSEAEVAEQGDFDNISLFAREGVDHVVGGAVGYPNHWSAFTVAKKNDTNPTVAVVSPGRLFNNEIVYDSGAAIEVDLMLYMPTVTANRRWVGLVVQGEEETESESRLIETDADSGETVSMSVPKVITRKVKIIPQQGPTEIADNPTKPAVPAGQSCIAFVLLGTGGILDIAPGTAWRAKTLYEVEGRVTALEVQLESAFIRVATLETDLANLTAHVNALPVPRPEIIRQVRRDVAAMRRQLDVPAGARSDWYDPGLLPPGHADSQWDATHASWLARISEGIRFPFASVKEVRLEMKNEDSPLVKFSGRRMMPAWTPVKRIYNEGGTATRDISQLVHTVITTSIRTVARNVWEYGPTVSICENNKEWNRFPIDAAIGTMFSKDGEVYQTVGMTLNQKGKGHDFYGVRTMKLLTIYDTYTDYNTTPVGINGSIYGQNFLVAQPMIAPSVELEFSRIGPDGAVHLFLVETTETGVPLFSRALASATIPHANLTLGWNTFELPPTYLTPGSRYAWYTVTTGNHQLKGSDNNAFSGGTSFLSTDGSWAQGDLSFDFHFRINSCRFTNTRTVIDFKAMTLTDGMTEFRLLYPGWAHEGTGLMWEIRPDGVANWTVLEPTEVAQNPLYGLPASVELRCTLLATPDLAPMIELTADAVVRTARNRGDARPVSKAIDLSLTTTQIQAVLVVDDFDPAVHTFSPAIMHSTTTTIPATLVAPTTVTPALGEIDPDKPTRRTFLCTWTVPAGTRYVRLAPGMVTTQVPNPFFIQNAALFAL